MNAEEYLKGQNACRMGKRCPENAHPDFERGYGKQYEWEQILDYVSSHQPEIIRRNHGHN
jgi:hypothetical protein